MEDSLPESVESAIRSAILACPGVSDPHNMRTRKIGNKSAVDVHVRMDGNITLAKAHETTRQLETDIKKIVGNDAFVMIHVEPIK